MSFQTHILNPTVANKTLSLSILGIFKPWNFPANLFCYPFGERDILKRSKNTRRSRRGKNRGWREKKKEGGEKQRDSGPFGSHLSITLTADHAPEGVHVTSQSDSEIYVYICIHIYIYAYTGESLQWRWGKKRESRSLVDCLLLKPGKRLTIFTNSSISRGTRFEKRNSETQPISGF